jgi:hypothetical protein
MLQALVLPLLDPAPLALAFNGAGLWIMSGAHAHGRKLKLAQKSKVFFFLSFFFFSSGFCVLGNSRFVHQSVGWLIDRRRCPHVQDRPS